MGRARWEDERMKGRRQIDRDTERDGVIKRSVDTVMYCGAVVLCFVSVFVMTITPNYEDTDTHVLSLSSSPSLFLSHSVG